MARQDNNPRSCTRLQAARNAAAAAESQPRRGAKRPRAASDNNIGVSTRSRARREAEAGEPAAKKQAVREQPVLQYIRALEDAPTDPQAQQHLPEVLQMLVNELAALQSTQHSAAFYAVFAVAAEAPGALLQAILAEAAVGPPRSLRQLVDTLHTTKLLTIVRVVVGTAPCYPAATTVVQGAALMLAALARAAREAGTAAVTALSDALLNEQQQHSSGAPSVRQQLLQAMCSSDATVAQAAGSAIALLTMPGQQLPPAPEAAALIGAWLTALLQRQQQHQPQQQNPQQQPQQQQGLQLLLQALEHEPLAPARIILNLATAAPGRLLAALFSPAARRSLQLLLRALDSSDSDVSALLSNALAALAQAADGQQLKALLQHMVRAVQRRSRAALDVLVAAAAMPAAHAHLLQHMWLLAQLLGDRQLRYQISAVAILFQMMNVQMDLDQALIIVPDGQLMTATVHAAVQQGVLHALLHGMVQEQQQQQVQQQGGGGGAATPDDFRTACAAAVYIMSRIQDDVGRQALVPHTGDLLAACQAQHPAGVMRHAIRTVHVLASDASAAVAGLQAVAQHAGQVLAVMLQRQHAEAAEDAGWVVLTLSQSAAGLQLLSQQAHIDSLLQDMQQPGPATPHAVRAVAGIAAAGPEAAGRVSGSPFWQAGMQGIGQMLPGIQARAVAAAAGDQPPAEQHVWQAAAPVVWGVVAAAACRQVPCFLGVLVALLQGMPLVMPSVTLHLFDALSHLTVFRKGLLALAPHMQGVQAAVHAAAAAQTSPTAGLVRQRLAGMVAQVQREVQQVVQEQLVLQGRVQHVAVQLAQVYGRFRRRPRTRKLQAGVTVLLLRLGQLSAQNDELLQQLEAARGVRV